MAPARGELYYHAFGVAEVTTEVDPFGFIGIVLYRIGTNGNATDPTPLRVSVKTLRERAKEYEP